MRSILVLCAMIVAASQLAGCPAAPTETPVQESGEGGIVTVSADDPEMDAAMEQARATLDQVIEAIPNRSQGHLDIMVKAGFDYPDGGVEHIWLVVEGYQDGAFHAWVGNEPVYTDEVAYNDEIDLPRDRVSDWMIVEDGVMRGGYTVRLIRDRMTPEERAAWDVETPFTISETP